MQHGETVIYDKVDMNPILFNNQGASVGRDLFDFFYQLEDPKVWYIVDGKRPHTAGAKTILVCSPRKSYYEELDKLPLATTRYMPVWDKKEIDACWDLIYRRRVNKETVDDLFYKWGGIPRFVLEKANDITQQNKLKEAIDRCDETLLIASIGGSHNIMNHHSILPSIL